MERRWSQRIMASFSRDGLFPHRQAHADIAIAVLRNLLPVAGRKRESVAVVDRATRNRVRDGKQTRVIFVTPLSICLQRESPCPGGGVCMYDLNVERLQQ